MPKITTDVLLKAARNRFTKRWPEHRELKAFGVTEKQIRRYRQSGKILSCSKQAATLIRLYASDTPKPLLPILAAIIKARNTS